MLKFSEFFEFSSENSWILKEFSPNSDLKSSNGSVPRRSNLSSQVGATPSTAYHLCFCSGRFSCEDSLNFREPFAAVTVVGPFSGTWTLKLGTVARLVERSFKNSGIFARKLKNSENFNIFWNIGEIPIKFHQDLSKITEKNSKITNFCKILPKNAKKIDENFLKYWGLSGAKACKSCRSRQELSNEYFLARFCVDTAANEPYKVWSFGWEIRVRFDIEPFN